MEIKEIKKDGLKREYELSLDSSKVNSHVDKYLVSLGTKIAGFRNVKDANSLSEKEIAVRASKLRVLHKDHIKSITEEVLLRMVYGEMATEKLPIASSTPNINFDESQGEVFKFKTEFEVIPDGVLDNINIAKVTKCIAKISDEDVSKAIEEEAKNRTKYTSATAAYKFKEEDIANINMDAIFKEETHSLLSNFEVNKSTFIPEFFEKLIGKKVGEKIEFEIVMPKDLAIKSGARKLGGKIVNYCIEINSINKADSYKADEDFAKDLKFESLDKLREYFKGAIQSNSDALSKSLLQLAIKDELIKSLKFEVPTKVLEYEKLAFERDQKNKDVSEKDKENIIAQNARFSIFMSEYIRKNNIQASNQEIQIAYIATGKRYKYEDLKSMVESMKFTEKLMEFPKEVIEKEVSFEELKKMSEKK
jgi:trigger factor